MAAASGPFQQNEAVASAASWQHPLPQHETLEMGPSPYPPPPYERVIDMNAPPSAPALQHYPQGSGPTEATPLNVAPVRTVGDGRGDQSKKSFWTIPTVDVGCFGCCSLETCCKVQGYLSAIGSVIVLILAIFIVGGSFLISSALTHSGAEKQEKTFLTVLVAVMGFVLIVVSVFTLICAIRFIQGIKQRLPNMMVPYIQILYVHLGFLAINMLLRPENIPEGILYFVVASYYLICARSLHERMLHENENQVNKSEV